MKENEKVLIHSYMSYRQRNAKNGRHNEKNEFVMHKKNNQFKCSNCWDYQRGWFVEISLIHKYKQIKEFDICFSNLKMICNSFIETKPTGSHTRCTNLKTKSFNDTLLTSGAYPQVAINCCDRTANIHLIRSSS